MLGLNLLGNAVRQLAENLNALSRTVAEVNTGLRQRLALDQAEAEGLPALPEPADPEAPAERGCGGPLRRPRPQQQQRPHPAPGAAEGAVRAW